MRLEPWAYEGRGSSGNQKCGRPFAAIVFQTPNTIVREFFPIFALYHEMKKTAILRKHRILRTPLELTHQITIIAYLMRHIRA